MRLFGFILLVFLTLISCQSNTQMMNEIVFVDVIGNYVGECAEYSTSISELSNSEEATLSVIASTISSAGIKASCERIVDSSLPVKSASASRIEFESTIGSTTVKMTYIAVSDSIVVLQTSTGENQNLIFTGKRQ